jgi:hypothetical protein
VLIAAAVGPAIAQLRTSLAQWLFDRPARHGETYAMLPTLL